ncbi:MAG: hypothetical protein HWE33_17255 [Rhodobacteraceae bacterium]|nr:hypothetical protein [Paracoccaceae bacterium]
MFHNDGQLCALDCIQEIATRFPEQINSRQQAQEVFREFVSLSDRAWLIGVSGEKVEVGRSFLAEITTSEFPSPYIGPDGLTRRRYPVSLLSDLQKKFLKAGLLGIGTALAILLLYRLPQILYSQSHFAVEQPRLPLEWALISLGQGITSTLVIGLLLAWAYVRWVSYTNARQFALPDRLLGLSLVFDRQELNDFLNTAFETASHSERATVANERAATEYILRSYRENNRIRKADLQAILCAPKYIRRVSVRGFNRAWDKAREAEPKLGKPGPKS